MVRYAYLSVEVVFVFTQKARNSMEVEGTECIYGQTGEQSKEADQNLFGVQGQFAWNVTASRKTTEKCSSVTESKQLFCITSIMIRPYKTILYKFGYFIEFVNIWKNRAWSRARLFSISWPARGPFASPGSSFRLAGRPVAWSKSEFFWSLDLFVGPGRKILRGKGLGKKEASIL